MPHQLTIPGFPQDGWPEYAALSGSATTDLKTSPASGQSHYIAGMITDAAVTIARGTGLENILINQAVAMTFPHAIEIGNAAPLSIIHTVNTKITLFGYTDKRMT